VCDLFKKENVKYKKELSDYVHHKASGSRPLPKEPREPREPSIDKKLDIAMGALRKYKDQIFENFASDQEAKENEPEQFEIHNLLKAYFKDLIRRKKGSIENIVKRMPKNKEEMHKRLCNIKENKDINFYIRQGRIIHYEFSSELTTLRDTQTFIKKYEDSKYHTAAGQHEIKVSEATYTMWLTAVSNMARTLQDWIDPDYELAELASDPKLYDLLINVKKEGDFEKIYNDNFFTEKLYFLFGDTNFSTTEKTRKTLFFDLLKTVSSMRHNLFHFKNPEKIIDLKETSKETLNFITHLYETDFKNSHKYILKQLKGVGAENHLSHSQLYQILSVLTADQNCDDLVMLPKLARMLKRVNNVPEFKTICALPEMPNAAQQEEFSDIRLRYTLLKLLYNEGFGTWLQNHADWRSYADKAIQIANTKAHTMNDKNTPEILIAAKASKINLNACDKYMDVFYKLTQETAIEMQVQKGYQSNADESKEQAKHIENLKCDIVGLAFSDYLKEYKLAFLYKDQEALIKHQDTKKSKLPVSLNPKQDILDRLEDTQKKSSQMLYAILHLMPVEIVADLKQQMIKYDILKKQNSKEYHAILDLYLKMHDAKFTDNQNITNPKLDKFKAYYEGNCFDKIFCNPNNPLSPQAVPHRGLREMLRHSDINKLDPIFTKYIITEAEYQEWQQLDGQIASLQKEKKTLHEKWVKSNRKLSEIDKKTYDDLVKKISKHNELTKSLYLKDHRNLYKLLMSIMGRFVKFANHYERDLYFITLAKMSENVFLNDEYHLETSEKAQKDGVKGIKLYKRNFTEDNQQSNKLKQLFKEMNANKFLSTGKEYFSNPNLDKLRSEIKLLMPNYDIASQIRDNIAHFNYLNDQTRNEKLSITSMVNDVRKLMAYDRKMKNAIPKAIQDLLKREGFTLKWEMEKHQLKFKSLTADPIDHIGGKSKGVEKKHGDKYTAMVTELIA